MKHLSYPCYYRSSRGQAIVTILILIGMASLCIMAIAKVALWRLDGTIALLNQHEMLTNWESKRVGLIKDSISNNSFKRVRIESNSLAIPVIPKRDIPANSLRIPIFRIGDSDNPLLNWDYFLKSGFGSCAGWEGALCNRLQLATGKALVEGDIRTHSIPSLSGKNIVIGLNNIIIDRLTLEPGAALELVAVFDIQIREIISSPDSTLFLKTIFGRINLTGIDSLDCQESHKIRVSSNHPIRLNGKNHKTAGCLAIPISDYWQNIRFLGDLSKKTLGTLQ